MLACLTRPTHSQVLRVKFTPFNLKVLSVYQGIHKKPPTGPQLVSMFFFAIRKVDGLVNMFMSLIIWLLKEIKHTRGH